MTHPTHGGVVAGQAPLAPEWQQWIAENLLRGVSAPEVARTLHQSGIAEATAVREVQQAAQHPYLQAAAAALATKGPAQGGGAPAESEATAAARADKYAWFLEVSRRAAKLAPGFGTVPRVQRPSRQEVLEGFYAQNRPCVIEGAMDDWPALTRWSPEYLKAGRAEQAVEVEVFRDADAAEHSRPARERQTMPFGDFVDAVEGEVTNGLYMTAGSTAANAAVIENLWGDIVYPDYLDPDHPIGPGLLWYGPAGTVTPIHHDLTNNLMAQVRGRKRVRLIAPNESADVPSPAHDRYSPIDIEAPDLAAHPSLERVTIMEVEIGPGDMLFIPAGWWHGVRSLDTSITITFMNFVFETDFYSFHPPGAQGA